jgi:glutamyl-tRNA reductase
MNIYAIGCNHKTAPIDLRERMVFLKHDLAQALPSLLQCTPLTEAVIISTCNRTEIYYCAEQQQTQAIVAWLAQYKDVSINAVEQHTYQHAGVNAVTHLARVACGLNSMVLGEPQILGQIKQAYQIAVDSNVVGRELRRLFQFVFSVAKRVRYQTAIGQSSVSVASVAMQLLKSHAENMPNLCPLLIGSGETIELCLRYMQHLPIERMIIASRSLENAEKLAKQYQAKAISIADIPMHLARANVVISATACPMTILTHSLVVEMVTHPMVMLDLSVPRDIEPDVGKLANIQLYCVDTLQDKISAHKHARSEAALQAEQIIEENSQYYMRWLKSLSSIHTLRCYRDHAETVRESEIQKAMVALRKGENPETVLTQLAYRLTNKLAHTPTKKLREASIAGETQVITAAQQLFNLHHNNLESA